MTVVTCVVPFKIYMLELISFDDRFKDKSKCQPSVITFGKAISKISFGDTV